ncbi:hypothetical protein MJO28_009612 [Puccinia striiformis f. sp. tritici]|uniref:Uncharacterized protein n=4 Tax=Puccinia striiformis TaxID=27350 RepID=A0A0L0V7V3_9BASI|nr:hypothetical protein Pst134EA_017527 [Puccinia striiformis f. sp. tritici]KAI9607296.1 hypothetical protein H4Q26_005813 [Puccinia striiformis f. sp. tritici PST-130]KNE95054.1 hypothetical protein PSTG_11647 [Puccinia striiformis f. sp. tritici PST-78]POW17862.1 hypothetical protein PSTT_00032 [Puccinia striiformis]KAH9450916.1 hypothetical protein Pst134EB_018425 [Puccinia striiformis f. sp. tritici]KAH9461218.1 hypothetical protein Pst134EA_017527 [Puccinia striiformis f. sp. tritici]
MNQSNLDPFFLQSSASETVNSTGSTSNTTTNHHHHHPQLIHQHLHVSSPVHLHPELPQLDELMDNGTRSIIVEPVEPQLASIQQSGFNPTQETLFNEHASHYQLNGPSWQQARRVCQTTGDDNRFYALVCYMTWLHQNPTNPPPPSTAQVQLAPPVSAAAGWVPTTRLREHTRFTAQMIIIRSDLEAYTATKDSEDRVLQKSFQNLVIKHFTDQSEAFRVANLPAGFPSTTSPEPANKLFNFIREIIKHNRDSFRKQLLKNILPEDGDYPKKPIPSLDELIVQLLTAASSPGHLPVPSEILSKVDETQRMRFAYLRLEAIRFYAGPSPKNKRISQWSIIDGQLEHLRRQEPIYQQAFFGLILEKDCELFGTGLSYFRNLETTVDWDMPSDQDIRRRAQDLHQAF